MTNCKIIDILNNMSENKYDFKIKNATLKQGGNICVLEIYYKDGIILSQENRVNFERIINDNMPKGFTYEIRFVKNFINTDSIIPQIDYFFEHNHPAILYKTKLAIVENGAIKAELIVDEKSYERFENKRILSEISQYLTEYFCCDADIVATSEKFAEVEVKHVENDFDLDITEPAIRTIDVTDVMKYIGEQIDEKPVYIKDIKTPTDTAVICGKITFFKDYVRKPKEKEEDKNKKKEEPKTNEELEKAAEEKAKTELSIKKYYKMAIEDFTGKMSAIAFSTKSTLALLDAMQVGAEVVVRGKVEEDKFSDGLSMVIKEISTCKLPAIFTEQITWKEEPKQYRYIYPEEMEAQEQVDLFAFSSGKEKPTPKHLQNKDFVVFDFETTGLHVFEGDKIIEIGAVKIKNGKIAERFMCFVNPEKPISAEITSLTGITDKDVANAHTIEKVMPDFYKFTRNVVLVGQNVSFDYGFLNYYGKKCGYNFETEMEDTWQLAMQNLRGLKNYKLKTICARLGVSLENAHRAVHDATATAECFIKLYEIIEQNT